MKDKFLGYSSILSFLLIVIIVGLAVALMAATVLDVLSWLVAS